MSPISIYTPGWRETKWSKLPCLRKQRDGRGLNPRPEFEELTARPHTPPLFLNYIELYWELPWVPETFLARFPVSVKSLWWPALRRSWLRPTAEDVSAFGQHRKFPPYARKTSGTQGNWEWNEQKKDTMEGLSLEKERKRREGRRRK